MTDRRLGRQRERGTNHSLPAMLRDQSIDLPSEWFGRLLTFSLRQAGHVAAKAATATIPIVFGIGADPVQLGLVASMNRPGSNVSGITSMSGELGGKPIGLLQEPLPRAARFAMIIKPSNPTNVALIRDAQAAASAMGGSGTCFV
jgi:hypothetical protein